MVERALDVAEEAYRPVRWRLDDWWDSRFAFDQAVLRLEMTSSPGLPYCTEATTIGAWLKWNGVFCDAFQLDRLWHDTQEVLRGNYDVWLRVFIKPELHKQAKAAEGRWRLIMAAPLNVQVAWSMVFGTLNDLEIEKSIEIPSQQGLAWPGGRWKDYERQWRARGYDCGLDKSAWDWTAPQWALRADLELRSRLGNGRRMGEWMRVAEDLYSRMFLDPFLVTTEGEIFRQTHPGVMKSGCVNTISSNSHMQIITHIVACQLNGEPVHPLPVACGDDTLQRRVLDASPYKLMGIVVKHMTEGLEFMGHEVTSRGPIPVYHLKHVLNLLYKDLEEIPEYLDAMMRMYVHDADWYGFWEALSWGLDLIPSSSRVGLLRWYDLSVDDSL